MSDENTATLWVDVSHHDRNRRGGPLDWAAIRQATSPIMCARAWYGDPAGYHNPSPYWAEHQQGARAAGFTTRGGYMNLIHGDQASINRQVDAFRGELDAQQCNWAMADCEPYEELVNNNLWPRMDDLRRLNDRWYAVEHRVLSWYVPMWFWQDHHDGSPSLGSADLRVLHGPLVQSHYVSGNGRGPRPLYDAAGGNGGTGWDDFYGGRFPDVWQYSSTCTCPGATDATDVNAFPGPLAAAAAALTGGGSWLMALTDEEQEDLYRRVKNLDSAMYYGDVQGGHDIPASQFLLGFGQGTAANEPVPYALMRKLDDVLEALKTGGVDVEALAAALAPLLPKPQEIAEAVLDEDHRRSES